jgi:hypothetical protein
MDNLFLILAEVVSTILCFILVRYMIKPYQYTGESRYVGLPLGFVFLGLSYLFMGFALFSDTLVFIEDMKWLQLLTQAFAFAFLAVTYYFSKRPIVRAHARERLWWQITFTGLIFALVISYLIVFVPPTFVLPSYKTVDEYFRLVNIFFASYISLHALRSHMMKPENKTIWFPLGYVLLVFGQYSLLVWSLDSSFIAFVGAHLLRLTGLLIFLLVSLQTFTPFRDATKERERR